MNSVKARVASLNVLRDWLAQDDGWKPVVNFDTERWVRAGERPIFSHPYPATIDGASSAMPEGWTWQRVLHRLNLEWWAQHFDYHHAFRGRSELSISILDSGDEILDRYRLAVLARLAMREYLAVTDGLEQTKADGR